MKLKVPPIVVFFVFGALMYLLAEFLPVGYFDFFGRSYLSIALSISAVIIAAMAFLQFTGAKTTIDPFHPARAKKLVQSGVYSFTRNPMYLALLLLLLAWGIWLGNAFNSLLAAGFVAYLNRFQIVPEERILAQSFEMEYKQYCLLVRRWF